MSELFKRVVEVIVGTKNLTGLKITFEVKKSLKPEPNTATVAIWNLNEDSRKSLEEKEEIPVQIIAGYKGSETTIYLGNLRRARSEQQGPDIVTTLTSGDGEKEYKTSRVNKSYKKGTPIKTVVKDLASSLGASLGNLQGTTEAAKLVGTSDTSLKHGVVMVGSVSREFTQLLGAANLEWSIQDTVLQVLKKKENLKSPAILLSASSGMLGSPTVDNKGILSITSLLIPDLQPGRIVVVESRFIKGQFRTETATFSGDTHSDLWQVQITGKKY